MTHPQPTPSAEPQDVAAALAALAATLGMAPEALAQQIASTVGAPEAPTVEQHVADFLSVLTPATRETYATHLLRAVRGVGPVCDQTCEPCIERVLPRLHIDKSRVEDYFCRCDCKPCVSSRITIQPLGQQRVGPAVYTLELTQRLAVVARRYAIKSGIVDNRARARRGQPPKKADGHNAQEAAITAVRALFGSASDLLGGKNPAQSVDKPKRDPKERRPLQPFELAEIHLVTCTGGNDPELDRLILDTAIATGARVLGLETLTVGQLDVGNQMIKIKDKGGTSIQMPVSAELIAELLQHAISRGGAACDPASGRYVPDSRVFRNKKGGTPINDRRMDRIAERWQRSLPWAMQEGVTFHYIRHTISSYLAQIGPQYKKRYLRHADNSVTDIYGKCPIDQFAGVMASLLGFEHPLVHGMDDRRAEALKRLGLAD